MVENDSSGRVGETNAGMCLLVLEGRIQTNSKHQEEVEALGRGNGMKIAGWKAFMLLTRFFNMRSGKAVTEFEMESERMVQFENVEAECKGCDVGDSVSFFLCNSILYKN